MLSVLCIPDWIRSGNSRCYRRDYGSYDAKKRVFPAGSRRTSGRGRGPGTDYSTEHCDDRLCDNDGLVRTGDVYGRPASRHSSRSSIYCYKYGAGSPQGNERRAAAFYGKRTGEIYLEGAGGYLSSYSGSRRHLRGNLYAYRSSNDCCRICADTGTGIPGTESREDYHCHEENSNDISNGYIYCRNIQCIWNRAGSSEYSQDDCQRDHSISEQPGCLSAAFDGASLPGRMRYGDGIFYCNPCADSRSHRHIYGNQ